MNRDPVPDRESLAHAMRRAGDALATQAPPAAVHEAVRAALAAARPQFVAAPTLAGHGGGRRSFGAGGPRWWAAAACATLLIASTALLLVAAPADPSPRAMAALAEAAFVPVAPIERWPAATPQGGAPAWLVSAEMPRERLAAWGLPFDPARAGEAVRAELLMRPSGEVLAVRVLHADADR